MGRHKRQTIAPDGSSAVPSGRATMELEPEKKEPLSSLKTEYMEGADDVQAGTGEAVDPSRQTEKPRRIHKRRTKAEIESERARNDEDARNRYAQSAQAFSQASCILLDFILRRMPNPSPASPEERQLFSAAVGAVAVKWLPEAAGYDAELTLAAALLVVVAPRMLKGKPEPLINSGGVRIDSQSFGSSGLSEALGGE